MQPFPHHYAVAAQAEAEGGIGLTAANLPALASAAPAEFDGPGDRWSPETLLVGAVADCFVLTFRGIAARSRLAWTSIRCEASGTLDRVDGVTRFTTLTVRPRVVVPAGTSEELARRVLESAERNCLISNSLKAEVHLVPEVHVEATSNAA